MFSKLYFITILMLMTISIQAQEVLSLDDCYTLAKNNHPLQAENELLSTQHDLEQKVLITQKLPKLELAAQATYQSDVISLPISLPNTTIEIPNQEQWRATFTASQLIYNGGLINVQKEIKKAELGAKQQEIEVNLFSVKSQINQLYFNILLLDQKKEVLQKNKAQLQQKTTEVESRIKYGVAPEGAVEPLQVKLLELQQEIVEIEMNDQQLRDRLSLLIGKNIPKTVQLTIPNKDFEISQNKRPELALFDLQKEVVSQNEKLLRKKNAPKLIAFGTGGVGNPGLNMLDNSVQQFYIVGAKLQWNIFDWNATKKQRQAIAINKDIIDNQQQVFEWQQDISAKQYLADIEKNKALLASDKSLIALHKKIVETASKQLKHDIITTADYTAEVNKLVQAEINQKTHEIQLQMAKANYQITMFDE